MFRYYGSSSNLGIRFKYHYFNGPKQSNFLGLFLSVFGWSNFSITVVEVCPREDLLSRENWYLSYFQPTLNVLTSASVRISQTGLSMLTRSKISASLLGRKDSEDTRMKKSKSRMGNLNPFFGRGLDITALNKAAEISGTKVYVYSIDNMTLVNTFRSLRSVCKVMPISDATLPSKLNTGTPFKGYYYYTSLLKHNKK